ncbi:MAG: universal stress protein [Methanocellales archaeon]|nr:universal stress protein [Methanocellales archaeon]
MTMKLLVAVDGSPEAEKAVRYALQFAKDSGASITVLHVITSSVAQKESEKVLARVRDIAKEIGIECNTKSYVNSVISRGIIDEAERGDFDQIIMGSRGLTGLKRVLLGSVADSVTHYAHCPVTIVR